MRKAMGIGIDSTWPRLAAAQVRPASISLPAVLRPTFLALASLASAASLAIARLRIMNVRLALLPLLVSVGAGDSQEGQVQA